MREPILGKHRHYTTAFFTVFLKSGLLGVLLFILFIYYFSKTNKYNLNLQYYNYLLLVVRCF